MCFCTAAFAAPPGTGSEFPTQVQSQSVVGTIGMCLNSSGRAVPWFNSSGSWQCAGSAVPVSGTFSAASGFIVTGNAQLTLTANSTSYNVALGSAGPVVVVYNPGTSVVYGKLSVGAGTAATTDTPIAPASYQVFNTNGTATYFNAITTAGAGTILSIPTGTGSPSGWGGGSSGGGGGNVTITSPLGTQTIAASVAVTPATSSLWTIGQGGAVLSATNGLFSNILQGNAALTAANPIFSALSIGGAVNAVGNPIFVSPGTGATFAATQSGTWTVQPGNTANTTPWLASISQGGNTAVVKPASTSPLTTDAALVVAMSPNSGIQGYASGGAQTGANIINDGGIYAGNIYSLQLDAASGNLKTNCVVGCTGVSASVGNPTSTLALPATTTAYSAGTLLCTSATVATCNTALASEFFTIANTAGGVIIPRMRLQINDATSTSWPGVIIQIDLWSAAPTFATTGDRGVFTTDFATGSQNHLGAYTCVMSTVLADGEYAECYPTVGNSSTIKLASGTSIFWTATAVTASGVTGASKTVTVTLEDLN